MLSPNVKIFVCYHKEAPIFESNCIIPIHVGKANSSIKLNMIGDNTGNNISEKNSSFCELTALYWMWKNVEADYYGLFHYRRFLNFNKVGGGYDVFTHFDNETINSFGFNDEKIRKICSQYDVITSPIWGVHPVGLPNLLMSNYDSYAKEHFIKDLDTVINLVKIKSPSIYPYILKALYSKESFFANMQIMKKEYFHEYCEWLFDILFEAEKVIDISSYDSYQKRIWGFIAERLANGYLEYLKSNSEFKHTSLGMVYGIFNRKELSENTIIENVRNNIERAVHLKSDDVINIAFAIDDNYAKHCAGAIQSIISNANQNQKFQIFIICDNQFSNELKLYFLDFENENISIKFLPINVSDFSIYPLNREHISIATYYRLALHKILPNDVSKVIYLDADLVVLDNICQLWDIDFEDNFLAGSPDEGGITQIKRLNLPVTHNYINAGICVMNMEKMRTINLDHLYAESYYKNKDLITLQDQDILNIAFQNKIKKLDCRWNVQSRFYKKINELEYSYSAEEEIEAALNPAIVHYSDREKPWHTNCSHILKCYYKYYQNALNNNWKSIRIKNKPTINDYIKYEKNGHVAQLSFSYNDERYYFSFKGKVGKRIGKIIYNIVRVFVKIFIKIKQPSI